MQQLKVRLYHLVLKFKNCLIVFFLMFSYYLKMMKFVIYFSVSTHYVLLHVFSTINAMCISKTIKTNKLFLLLKNRLYTRNIDR